MRRITSRALLAGLLIALLFSLCACVRDKEDPVSFQCNAFQASHIKLPVYEKTNISVWYATSTKEHIVFLQSCTNVVSEQWGESRSELVWTDFTGNTVSTQVIDRTDGFVPMCLVGSSDIIYAIGTTDFGTTLAISYDVSGPTGSNIDFGAIPQFEHATYVDGVFAFRYGGGSAELFRDGMSIYTRQDYQDDIFEQRLAAEDGKIVYVGMNKEHNQELVVIDPSTLTEKVIPLSSDLNLLWPYNSSVGLFYKDFYALNRLNTTDGTMETFMSLRDTDLPPSEEIFTINNGSQYILDKNHIVYIYNPATAFEACDPAEIILLTRLDKNPHEGKTVLTIGGNAVTMDPSIQYAVYLFNTSHSEYRIHLTEYAKEYPYSTMDEYTRTLARVIGDMSSGKGDDMLYGASLFDLPQLGRNGMLVDMMPYLESDPDISAEDWLPSLFNLMQTDGVFYRFFPGFWFEGNFGKKEFFPDPQNASVVELMRIMQWLPENVDIFPESLAVEMIASSIVFDVDAYIDESGKFRISEEQMQTLLDYALEFGGLTESIPSVEDRMKGFLRGNLLLYHSPVASASDYNDIEKMVDEEIVFTGFPTLNGTARLCVPSAPIAISDATEHPDICWEFVKTLMSPEIQQRMIEMTLFPVSQEAFDDYMNKAMHPEFRNASEDSALDGSDKSSVSEDCVNRLRIIVDSLNVTNETDYILGNIIIEECLPAVNGQKSAAETAEVLSDRINLYLQSR